MAEYGPHTYSSMTVKYKLGNIIYMSIFCFVFNNVL